jgi:hypothetical protein
MRVRTGRFESLRSGQSWQSQSIKVRNAQNGLDNPVAVTPPAVAVARHLVRHIIRCPQRLEFPVDRPWPFPVFELNRPQTMAQPPSPHSRRIYAASPWSQELHGLWPTRPAWQHLLCGSCSSAHDLRFTLPPHVRSPSRSCASLHSL